MFYQIYLLVLIFSVLWSCLLRWASSELTRSSVKDVEVPRGVLKRCAEVLGKVAGADWSQLPMVEAEARPGFLERYCVALSYIITPLLLLAAAELFGRYTGVMAFDYSYAISDVQASSFGIIAVFATWTDAFAKSLNNAIGTDPEKNWRRHMDIIAAQSLDRSALGVAFVLCHYSANPSVWERIMKNLVDDPALTAITDATPWIVSLRAFIKHCEWKTGAPTTGKLSPSRFHGSNPTLAAVTYFAAYPNSMIGYKHLTSKRFMSAMYLEDDVKADIKKAQETFVKDVLKKSFNDKMWTLISSSTFWFASATNSGGTLGYVRSPTHGPSGSTVKFGKTQLGAWSVENGGPSAADFATR